MIRGRKLVDLAQRAAGLDRKLLPQERRRIERCRARLAARRADQQQLDAGQRIERADLLGDLVGQLGGELGDVDRLGVAPPTLYCRRESAFWAIRHRYTRANFVMP